MIRIMRPDEKGELKPVSPGEAKQFFARRAKVRGGYRPPWRYWDDLCQTWRGPSYTDLRLAAAHAGEYEGCILSRERGDYYPQALSPAELRLYREALGEIE